jgi:hypothetical protein
MNIYQFYSYDTWGNEKEGYEVNDIQETGIFWVSEEFPKFVDIIKTLKRCGYLKKRYIYKSEYPYDDMEVITYKDMPLGKVEKTQNEEEINHRWFTFGGFPHGFPAVVFKQTKKSFRQISGKA